MRNKGQGGVLAVRAAFISEPKTSRLYWKRVDRNKRPLERGVWKKVTKTGLVKGREAMVAMKTKPAMAVEEMSEEGVQESILHKDLHRIRTFKVNSLKSSLDIPRQ